MEHKPENQLLSIRATARRLRRSRSTIKRAVETGDIFATTIGKRTLIPLAEVLRILGRQGEK
jgi:excisionase family DNA binding protein